MYCLHGSNLVGAMHTHQDSSLTDARDRNVTVQLPLPRHTALGRVRGVPIGSEKIWNVDVPYHMYALLIRLEVFMDLQKEEGSTT